MPKIQKYIYYIMIYRSFYILYPIIKTRQYFNKTNSSYQWQIILSKKNYFSEKKFQWKNGCKYGEEDATKNGWEIYYKDLQESQKLSQSREDQ